MKLFRIGKALPTRVAFALIEGHPRRRVARTTLRVLSGKSIREHKPRCQNGSQPRGGCPTLDFVRVGLGFSFLGPCALFLSVTRTHRWQSIPVRVACTPTSCSTASLSGASLVSGSPDSRAYNSYNQGEDIIDYYPFGGERLVYTTSTGTNTRLFTGKERDSESGNDNFAARYYSSSLGRFLSPDPENAGASVDTPQSWNAYSYVLNNPLNFIDPNGLDCAYLNDSGNGVESLDHHSNTEECASNGGYWYDGTGNAQVIQNASGDTAVIRAQTDSVTVTAPRETYLDCIKNDGDYFSLQHGLQSISGGRYGSSWLAGAVLGNSVSAGIEFGQSVYNRGPSSGVSPAAGEVLSRKGGAVAVSGAKNVPNLAVSVAGAAGVAIQTPSLSASASMTVRASGILPTGTLARAGARLLNGGLELIGHVKDPIDLSIASFSAVVCGIGR